MKLYNTLGRKLIDFKPQKGEEVSLYSCGPTVYDYPTIGNLRAYVFVDTLRRTLEVSGYKVKHVMNITDVGHLASDADEGEDKLEKGASREGKTVQRVAEHFTKVFKQDMEALNILPPNGYSDPDENDNYARATKFIKEQLEIVSILLKKDFAYKTEQAIYFDVSKLPSYGELTGQKLSDKEVGAREDVVTDNAKRNPQDFALWFFTVGRFKDHSMRWDSDWGEGFPGWHLECSAIIHATLGDPIDIHTGGVDHIGTHHTNEMAQTEAAYDNKLSHLWLHNEHMLVDGKKMSKSLGNFITLKDVKDKGFDPLALRLLFLQSHYRSQTNFTWESLEAAQKRLQDLRAWADLIHQQQVAHQTMLESADDNIKEVYNDLKTSSVLVSLESSLDKRPHPDFLRKVDDLLGLGLTNRPDITDGQKQLIEQREKARGDNDWSRADDMRNALYEQGIVLNDTASGPIWARVA